MKAILTLTIALAAGSLAAQSQRIEPSAGTATTRPSRETLSLQPQRNEIVAGKVTYTGFVVDVIKERNPIQVINPLTQPASPAEDTVIRDRNGKELGWKLLTVKF